MGSAAQHETTGKTNSTTNGAQAATIGAQETTRAWFWLANTFVEETDRQVEEGLRALSKFYEQYSSGRRNLLKLLEEGMEKSMSVAQSMATNLASSVRYPR